MSPDGELLRRYASTDAEDAFAELVQRHVNLVYSAALRQVNGDAYLAHDITQTVFTDLARKAMKLSHRPSLSGWLYTSTHFTAAKAVRTERRRQAHEQAAHAQGHLLESSTPAVDWEKLKPVLDGSLHQLKESDRNVILLRFFENQPFRDIGLTMGLSEDTARKRVDRAVEKLRVILVRNGVQRGIALEQLMSAHAIQAAPAGLATLLTHVTLATVATGSGTTITLLKTMTFTKFSAGFTGGVIIASLLVPLVLQKHELTRLTDAQQQLQVHAGQAAALRLKNEKLARQPLPAEPALSPDQLLELMKLRSDTGRLQQQLDQLQRELAARNNSATARALREPAGTNYFPIATWATAGNATPEAALQSISWK